MILPTPNVVRLKILIKSLVQDFVNAIQYHSKYELCSFGILINTNFNSFSFYYIKNSTKTDSFKSNSSYNEWWLPSWEYEFDREDLYNNYYDYESRKMELSSILEELHQSASYEETIAVQEYVFDLCCQCLKELKEESLFLKSDENFMLFVQEGDSEIKESTKRSLLKILTTEQVNKYIEEYDVAWW